ncbi:hypothetical protein QJS10_CPB11g02019 [Acorus calamus]|uniref:Heparan-alpha-glucosaminide N-acetyltransferase catalytic domain-containing protein n=1 Tax=Acorus calamus TaxID=4465 RepID=A0AAV9DRS2_ACOCL|nr:hypothetical protein QJS10_CPB11g02019 [Acorus calamus]
MADYVSLSGGEEPPPPPQQRSSKPRIASLDVFRGLSLALMTFVDYAGSVAVVAHSPWNGVHLADFVMPFFLFIAGISVALVYKNTSRRSLTSYKAMVRALKLFLLGVLLQGGYFHGLNSFSYGVDIEKIRWLGILQRIAIGYIVAALCEIWSPRVFSRDARCNLFKKFFFQWVIVLLISCIYLGLLYGLYVPDWQFKVPQPPSSDLSPNESYAIYTVKCGVRGALGPACNSAGMIDRYALGIEHLYMKPVYRNLQICNNSKILQVTESSPSWCWAPFEPEGILSSLMAVATCLIGLHYGHVLVEVEDDKDRLHHWLIFSVGIFAFGMLLSFIGIPLNKSLYTTSYMLITTASAGFTFCALYYLVDMRGFRCLTFILEWMGRHSLMIFIFVTSNIAVIGIQGFYWKHPENNIIHWIVAIFVHK